MSCRDNFCPHLETVNSLWLVTKFGRRNRPCILSVYVWFMYFNCVYLTIKAEKFPSWTQWKCWLWPLLEKKQTKKGDCFLSWILLLFLTQIVILNYPGYKWTAYAIIIIILFLWEKVHKVYKLDSCKYWRKCKSREVSTLWHLLLFFFLSFFLRLDHLQTFTDVYHNRKLGFEIKICESDRKKIKWNSGKKQQYR